MKLIYQLNLLLRSSLTHSKESHLTTSRASKIKARTKKAVMRAPRRKQSPTHLNT